MKFKDLEMGKKYKTKIGADWQIVVIASLRTALNEGKQERDKEVIVETMAGNQIYRTPGKLRKAD